MSNVPVIDALEPRRLFAAYIQQDLVSDISGAASRTDTRLKNPWGIAVGPKGIEVADNGTGLGTMYDASGNNVVGTVRVPGPNNSQGAPTGVALNPFAGAFVIGNTGKSAQFVYVTEQGTVNAWSGLKSDKTAPVVRDNSAANASYMGVAVASFRRRPTLYAADFGRGKVEAMNSTFKTTSVPGAFADPNLPSGYAPFNVTNIDNQLWVAYAKRDNGTGEEVAGKGLGVVNVFNTDGNLIRRFATGGALNAPWGITKSPADFGGFSNNILIGNFGDGRVTAFKLKDGARKGQISNFSGDPIELEGLWGIAFGNGRAGNLANGLYFAAGINSEANGLYGRLLVDEAYPFSVRALDAHDRDVSRVRDATNLHDLSGGEDDFEIQLAML